MIHQVRMKPHQGIMTNIALHHIHLTIVLWNEVTLIIHPQVSMIVILIVMMKNSLHKNLCMPSNFLRRFALNKKLS
jgi:hypothetical protein